MSSKHPAKTNLLIALGIAIGAAGAGPATAAVALGDGSYDLTFSVNEAGADFAGSTSVSGSRDAEAFDTLSDGSRYIGFSARLNSDLTLRLSVEPLGASGFVYPLVGTFVLTGLDLVVDGIAANVKGVSFDATATDIGQYANAGDFIAPTIAYSGTSAAIAFGFYGSGLAGDQPWIYLDVTTAVPEPGEWPLLVAGGPLLAWLVRLRRKQSAATADQARE
jgi:hypothetical protein